MFLQFRVSSVFPPLPFCQRKCKENSRPFTFDTVSPNVAAMGFNQFLGNSQPQSSSAQPSLSRFIRSVKTLKNFIDLLIRNTRPLIFNGDAELIVLSARFKMYHTAFW